jgi:hypothetical protein
MNRNCWATTAAAEHIAQIKFCELKLLISFGSFLLLPTRDCSQTVAFQQNVAGFVVVAVLQ